MTIAEIAGRQLASSKFNRKALIPSPSVDSLNLIFWCNDFKSGNRILTPIRKNFAQSMVNILADFLQNTYVFKRIIFSKLIRRSFEASDLLS